MKHTRLLVLLSIALVAPLVWADVVWVDANGVMLGDAQTNESAQFGEVYFELNDKLYLGGLSEGTTFTGEPLYYDQADCTGNAYIIESNNNGGFYKLIGIRGGIYYVGDDTAPPVLTIMKSYWLVDSGQATCVPEDRTENNYFLPATPLIDTNIYTRPYKLKMIPAN